MPTKDELIESIRRVASEIGFTGENYTLLRDALNERGITTLNGKPWSSYQNVRLFCNRNKIDFATQDLTVQDTVTDSASCASEVHCNTEKDTSTDSTADIEPILVEPVTQEKTTVLQFDESTTGELMDMLQWWRENRDNIFQVKASPQIEVKPRFKRDQTVTKTVRLSAELAKRAEREALVQKALTGGSLSGLVEVLLWRFLGSPDDLVIPLPEE
jgi:hypothetical protein